jgi:UDP-N-acetylmuramoyl-L-alanyl-D-glutamate--2,6-diaminopimelate ligase
VDYAHTADALNNALAALRPHVTGRLICVFGCGGDRDTGKRPEMAREAEQGADLVFVTDDNPRSEDAADITDQIVAGFQAPEKAMVIHDRAEAIQQAIAAAEPGDIVLIAGKGHEAWQEVAGQRIPFSDAGQVRHALSLNGGVA